MKKFLIAMAVAAIAVTGAFAQDALSSVTDAVSTVGNAAAANGLSGTLAGTWYDQKYDCNWVLTIDSTVSGLCELRDASTNALIYKFTRNNIQNFKTDMDVANGFTVSWECAEKNRTYSFNKPISGDGSPDLKLHVYHKVFDEAHDAIIVFKDSEARSNNSSNLAK